MNFIPLTNFLFPSPSYTNTFFLSVEAIQKMREELLLQNQENEALESWSGDPCMIYPWKGVTCDDSNGSSIITKL